MAIASRTHAYEQLLLEFLAYLEYERGLSRNTLEAYRSDLLQFGKWLRRTGREALRVDHPALAPTASAPRASRKRPNCSRSLRYASSVLRDSPRSNSR